MKKTLTLFVCASALVFSADATSLLDESFTYPDGDLTATSGGLWSAHSGAGSIPVTVSVGTITLEQGSGSREDVNRNTGGTMGAGDTWYAGFDLSVSGGMNTVYFAHFLVQGTSFFGSRVFVTSTPTGSGDFSLGVGSGSSPYNVWPSGLNFGDTHHVVVSYDYDTGNGQLWVDPTQQSDPSILTTNFVNNAFTSFAFRQSAGDSVQVIDNLKVATTFSEVIPEPTTLALWGLGGLMMLALRRRQ